jgi:hypothetical protein
MAMPLVSAITYTALTAAISVHVRSDINLFLSQMRAFVISTVQYIRALHAKVRTWVDMLDFVMIV